MFVYFLCLSFSINKKEFSNVTKRINELMNIWEFICLSEFIFYSLSNKNDGESNISLSLAGEAIFYTLVMSYHKFNSLSFDCGFCIYALMINILDPFRFNTPVHTHNLENPHFQNHSSHAFISWYQSLRLNSFWVISSVTHLPFHFVLSLKKKWLIRFEKALTLEHAHNEMCDHAIENLQQQMERVITLLKQ